MTERSFTPVEVPQSILDRFKKLPVATVWHIVHTYANVPLPFMHNVRPYTPGQRLAARARTMRYLPPRPDLAAMTPGGEDAIDYRAMSRCGPGDVLVVDIYGNACPAVFGDVKALQLRMNNADGVVTDGGIRDLGIMLEEDYGLIIYARDRTPYGGGPWAFPAEENVNIQCGGALVCPGDVLVGDDDGVVVVPSWFAEECVELTEVYETAEGLAKERILAERVVPGRHYPPGPDILEQARAALKQGKT
ncbi:MAG: hypothetical protein OXJ55_19425 [Caldilineaceae bacterium]|nr:hypothetical protein [Caldilineaceae bacterium]